MKSKIKYRYNPYEFVNKLKECAINGEKSTFDYLLNNFINDSFVDTDEYDRPKEKHKIVSKDAFTLYNAYDLIIYEMLPTEPYYFNKIIEVFNAKKLWSNFEDIPLIFNKSIEKYEENFRTLLNCYLENKLFYKMPIKGDYSFSLMQILKSDSDSIACKYIPKKIYDKLTGDDWRHIFYSNTSKSIVKLYVKFGNNSMNQDDLDTLRTLHSNSDEIEKLCDIFSEQTLMDKYEKFFLENNW